MPSEGAATLPGSLAALRRTGHEKPAEPWGPGGSVWLGELLAGQFCAGVFSAKYSWLSALSTARLALLFARLRQAD
jgi:hypothetical protein